jgi:hypothetical protein
MANETSTMEVIETPTMEVVETFNVKHSIFDSIHPNVDKTTIPENIMQIGIRLKSSIKLASISQKNIKYKKLPYIPSMETCGYTVPAIAICFLLLNSSNANTVKEYSKTIIVSSLTSKEEYITNGINQAIGYFWNHHTHLYAGIDYYYHTTPGLFSDKLLKYGPNIISFFNPTIGLSVHHSFIFYDPTYCIIVDSWAEEQCRRNPSIRLYTSSDVVEALDRINNIGAESVVELNYLMHNFFLSSNTGSYNKLLVRVFEQNAWIQIAKNGLTEGYLGANAWGIKKKKKKSKTQIKKKNKKSKKKK